MAGKKVPNRKPVWPRWSFKYVRDSIYQIMEYGRPYLIVKAFGPAAMVVDKTATAMTSKQTTDIDRYDFLRAGTREEWIEKSGPRTRVVDGDLREVLSKLAEHHESYLAKLVVE